MMSDCWVAFVVVVVMCRCCRSSSPRRASAPLKPEREAANGGNQKTTRTMDEFYAGKGVLVTGGSGFLGKVLLEKIVRCLPAVGTVFVLMRSKKGVDAEERFETKVLDSRIWDRLQEELEGHEGEFERRMAKLKPVHGDVNLPALGLSPEAVRELSNSVHVVFHLAASTQFERRLDDHIVENVLGTLEVAKVARGFAQLLAFVHVSTAFVNANLKSESVVEELVPELGFDAEAVVAEVCGVGSGGGGVGTLSSRTAREDRDPEVIEMVYRRVRGTHPNSYTLTKSMAESILVKRYGAVLPLAISRPAITGAAWLEPVPGWVDTVSAAGTVFLAGGMGMLRVLPGNPDGVAELVPVDMVINSILLLARSRAGRAVGGQPLVAHCSCGRENPLRWRMAIRALTTYYHAHPMQAQVCRRLMRRLLSTTTLDSPPTQITPWTSFRMATTEAEFSLLWSLYYTLPLAAFTKYAESSFAHKGAKRQSGMAKRWVLMLERSFGAAGIRRWRTQILSASRSLSLSLALSLSLSRNRLVKQAEDQVRLFRYFTMNSWRYKLNMQEAWVAGQQTPRLSGKDRKTFYVDPLRINWHRYLELFAYGMTKFYLGEEVVPVSGRTATETYTLLLDRGADKLYLDWDRERQRPVMPGIFHDAVWAYSKSVRLFVPHPFTLLCSALSAPSTTQLNTSLS